MLDMDDIPQYVSCIVLGIPIDEIHFVVYLHIYRLHILFWLACALFSRFLPKMYARLVIYTTLTKLIATDQPKQFSTDFRVLLVVATVEFHQVHLSIA